MVNVNPAHLVTGKVRLSYAHLFKPYRNPQNVNANEKYSVTILLPKSDLDTKRRLDAAINAAIQAGVQGKWGGVQPPNLAICIWDGDGVRQDGTPFGEECRGHYVFTASSDQPPQVVDAQCNPVIDQSKVYSGCYGRVSCNFFAYKNSGKCGIGCGLCNVQFLEDGEPLGNRTTAEADFGPPQPGYGAPQPGYGGQPAPVYGQPMPGYVPGQPAPVYGVPQIDPITGRPIGQ